MKDDLLREMYSSGGTEGNGGIGSCRIWRITERGGEVTAAKDRSPVPEGTVVEFHVHQRVQVPFERNEDEDSDSSYSITANREGIPTTPFSVKSANGT